MGKKVDPVLVSRFQKEQLLDLAKRSLTSVVAHFVLYVFIVLITPMKSDHPMVLAGFGIFIFVNSALRMVLAAKLPVIYDQAPERWTTIFKVLNGLSGLLWGGVALVMAIYYPLEWPLFFTLVICCGLAAGATSSLGPHLVLSRNFTLSIMLPLTIWGFYHGTSLGYGMGILCAFSMLMFIRMAKDNYVWYWDSIAASEKISKHTQTMERVFEGANTNAAELNQTSKNLTTSSGEMTRNAAQMSSGLSQVSQIAGKVNTNSHEMVALMSQTMSNFSNIASASEEMTATIADISQSAEKTREVTARAVSQTESAMTQMAGLAEAATAINKITEAIGEISEQINLLALNATIEAARAGEAGRGFAVVATEIKELAVQTSGSAGEISRQVQEIQDATQRTANEMEHISTIVQDADSNVENIATAVEEQSTATTEVSKNILQASEGVSQAEKKTGENDEALDQVAKEIVELEGQAKQVESGAGQVDNNAETLRRLARELVALVDTDEQKVS
ncbi:MAG: methyl-accepting chemotaxis protein [Desulfobacterales bacterium]|nr:methyl-accepting chemotaxis protein [Desulfobacterales bacterium]